MLGAEQAARQFELRGVVEQTPAAVGLPLAVAEHVPCGADARRDLVAEAELDAGVVGVNDGISSLSARTPMFIVRLLPIVHASCRKMPMPLVEISPSL